MPAQALTAVERHDGLSSAVRRATAQEKMLSPENIEALVLRAQDGDMQAFAGLVRAFLRPAYATALAVLRSPADAEDIAQEALLVAQEKLNTLREPRHFAAWLLTITRNRSLNALKRRKLHRQKQQTMHSSADLDAAPLPQQDSERAELRGALLEALKVLNDVQRQVVLLHDLEGWTHPEIADALGISDLMSRQHLFQARRKLRQELDSVAPKRSQR